MGALIVCSLTLMLGGLLATNLPWQFKAVGFGVYAVGVLAVGVGTFVMAHKNPRGLAYGPNEYLEESRLEHERKIMATRYSSASLEP